MIATHELINLDAIEQHSGVSKDLETNSNRNLNTTEHIFICGLKVYKLLLSNNVNI